MGKAREAAFADERLRDKKVRLDVITDYQRTPEELQYYFLYCSFTRGKGEVASMQAFSRMLDIFEGNVAGWPPLDAEMPFDKLRQIADMGRVEDFYRHLGLGQYTLNSRFVHELVYPEKFGREPLDLQHATREDIAQLSGIGRKMASLFLLHSRPPEVWDGAVLDRHVLRWLKSQGIPNVPNDTPGSESAYQRLEQIYNQLARAAGYDARALDLAVLSTAVSPETATQEHWRMATTRLPQKLVDAVRCAIDSRFQPALLTDVQCEQNRAQASRPLSLAA